MVASDKALPTRADVWISVVLSQLEGLVHPTVPVAQIRRLRVTEVSTEALDPTGGEDVE